MLNCIVSLLILLLVFIVSAAIYPTIQQMDPKAVQFGMATSGSVAVVIFFAWVLKTVPK